MKSIINYLVLSDIHLGHNTNKTEQIIENLKKYLVENHKLFKQLNIIFLAGDIFDKLLTNNSKEYLLAMEWLTELVLYCSTNNIKLRILEGTPSHDWRQSKLINSLITKLSIDIDFKYIDTIHIENIPEYNLNVLYIPDEYKHDAHDTYEDVKKLLIENNLVQVDIAIMHGQFNYQLPMVKLKSSHDESLYLDIVKYYIHIGHIHTPSIFDRILAQGSFDRLAHNEEEDKGGIFVKLIKDRESEFIFVRNKHAMLFKTYTYTDTDIEAILNDVDKKIYKLPMGSSVRCIVPKEVYLNKSIRAMREKYLGYNIKVETSNKEDVSNTSDLLTVKNIEESFHITKDNIHELLFKELEKHNLDNTLISVARSEFNLILEKIA
jgi:hypothetical protein